MRKRFLDPASGSGLRFAHVVLQMAAYQSLTTQDRLRLQAAFASGESRRQGGITKTGNTHARRLLVEAAWHHKAQYKVGKVLQARWDQASSVARARGHACNERLHHQWLRYAARGKKHTVANTAIARELAGRCWSLATLE